MHEAWATNRCNNNPIVSKAWEGVLYWKDGPLLQENGVHRLLQRQTESGLESHRLRVTGFLQLLLHNHIELITNQTSTLYFSISP